MRLRPRHLRTRLTLLYVSVLAAALILAWAGTCASLFFQLRAQLDHFSVQEIETVEGLFYFAPDRHLQMRENYHNHPESEGVIDRYLEVLSPNGAILFRNGRLGNRTLGGPILTGEGVNGYSQRSSRLSDGTPVRIASRVHVLEGEPLLIRLAHSEEPLLARIRQLVVDSSLVLPIILLGAGLAGYILAHRALTPIEQMARQAQEITPERLHARLPDDYADHEMRQLAAVFNETLGRLEMAFEQLRRFTADASHELRTPLAMIRSVGEVGLQKDGTRSEYRDIVGSMLEEVNRLTSLLDSLLTISRADSGSIQLHPVPIVMLELAREAAGIFEILIEEKGQRIIVEGDQGLIVVGDHVFLRQALVNVIHNAIKYSFPGQTISVGVRSGAGNLAVIEVHDDGPGIPVEDQQKVFDRFYRVDKARWRESGGAGLGLSIVKWAIEAHGGVVTLESEPGRGCTFRVALPAADGERPHDQLFPLSDIA